MDQEESEWNVNMCKGRKIKKTIELKKSIILIGKGSKGEKEVAVK